MIDSFCALVAMVVIFNGLGDVVVASVLAVRRRKMKVKRSIMKASGIVKGTSTDIGAMLLIVLLYPVSPMQ